MVEQINNEETPRQNQENAEEEVPASKTPMSEAVVPADEADPATTRQRQEQALMFEKYLDESGLCLSFQIIFTEIIQKQVPEDQVFPYTAMRLRQIGKELEQIDNKAGPAAGSAQPAQQ